MIIQCCELIPSTDNIGGKALALLQAEAAGVCVLPALVVQAKILDMVLGELTELKSVSEFMTAMTYDPGFRERLQDKLKETKMELVAVNGSLNLPADAIARS